MLCFETLAYVGDVTVQGISTGYTRDITITELFNPASLSVCEESERAFRGNVVMRANESVLMHLPVVSKLQLSLVFGV